MNKINILVVEKIRANNNLWFKSADGQVARQWLGHGTTEKGYETPVLADARDLNILKWDKADGWEFSPCEPFLLQVSTPKAKKLNVEVVNFPSQW